MENIEVDKTYLNMAKNRVCLALDVSTVKEAIDLSSELSDYIGMCKVGKEIHTAASMEGINIVSKLNEAGVNVFLDLKLHDTPNTVYKAAIASVVPNVAMFNVHIAGGEAMCKKALEGAKKGFDLMISKHGNINLVTNELMYMPQVIGVTELTSLNDADLTKQGMNTTYRDLVRRRTELAKEWGLDGIVCPASEAGALEKEFGSDLLYVTPGIKWEGKYREGQKQLYTPDLAVKDCRNSILVIGGAITERATAKERTDTASDILYAMGTELMKQK